MGCESSKYRIIISDDNRGQETGWIASPTNKLNPMKNENFNESYALRKETKRTQKDEKMKPLLIN